MFFKMGVLKKFANFTGEHPCCSLFNKLTGQGLQLYKKRDSSTGVSCEICEIFKDTYFYRTPVTASVKI